MVEGKLSILFVLISLKQLLAYSNVRYPTSALVVEVNCQIRRFDFQLESVVCVALSHWVEKYKLLLSAEEILDLELSPVDNRCNEDMFHEIH